MLNRLLSGDYPRSKVLAVILVAIFVGLAFAPFLFPGVKALSVADHGFMQTGTQLPGKGFVLDHHIGFACQQQTQWVQIGRPHCGPATIHDRYLGMQKARRVLMYLDTRSQQHTIYGAGAVVLHVIFIAPLQQKPHPHASARGMDKRATQFTSR